MLGEIGKLMLVHLLLMELRSLEGTTTDCETGQFQCRNERCIPTIWRCDDDDDCSDNSDEENCPKKTCATTDFACKNGQCVPARWRCDGEPECPDGSDEADSTCSRQTCPPEKFDCGGPTHKCVSLSWRCDGERDCENGADEEECAADSKACAGEEFQCRNRKCVAPVLLCDGDDDCGDGSDEEECSTPTCGPHEFRCNSSECPPGPAPAPATPRCDAGEFQCGSGECLRLHWKCDGDSDCKDKSDEANCPLLTCRPDEFQCGDGLCIHGAKQCNKVHDCPDSSDEAGCINATRCEGPLRFMCKNGECIEASKLCDSNKDCKDWSDEPAKECGLNECADNNGGCSHICTDRPIGYQCECPTGYKLLDKKTCGDINECENSDACSQICINYKGDYKCECYQGYQMDPVTKTCKAEGKSPYLMFTNRHEIRRIDLVKRDYTLVVPTLKNAVALDVAAPTGFPQGLALDWVHKNLYWTDSGRKSISVASADGKKSRVLIGTEPSEPRSIAVDPAQGFMYWSDWGVQAKIERAGMNGVDRQVLVSESIEWPNGITLDLPNRRLYWVDAKLHLISSVDFSGANRRVLLSSPQQLGHPFALAVFEDRLYWTDLEKEGVYSANRLTGLDVIALAEHLNNPHDVLVFHELRQPKAPDSCNMGGVANGGCEYLCLKAPQITDNSPKYTCACPDGDQLGADMRHCVTAAPTAKPKASVTSTTAMDVTTTMGSTRSTATNPLPAFTSTSVVANPASYTPRPVLGTPPPAPGSVEENSNPSHRAGHGRYLLGSNITVAVLGVVIPIVPVVATVMVGLLGAAGYLVWRNWRRRNTKSMNFDNPVYRKTTGEEEDEIHIGRTPEPLGHAYPAVGGGTCPAFIALPLGGSVPDTGTHWYSGQPMLSSNK
ncbi:hypothetical protein AAFF_G00239450 [Aldrovandia affinis]|uniref:EGF-like domain-containing protein n=1 Tax=Aldrovandia affinis TaxID=143900 RepID=A0AAD7RDV3_9TELE|nr:hypothetical protein AAFF_G00239450 [Aldrovandia affinis]